MVFILKTLAINAVILLAGSLVSAQNQVTVAAYRGGRQAALSLTFDDGLQEHYSLLFPRLQQLGLHATFGVIGKRMDVCPSNPDKATFSWDNAREMANAGHEIANHGWAHQNVLNLSEEELRREIYRNDSAITAHVGTFPKSYFFPGNRKDDVSSAICNEGRICTRMQQVSLGSKRSVDWFRRWMASLIRKEGWGVTMSHGITHGYDAFGCADSLWRMLDVAKSLESVIWIATMSEVAAYIAERQNTTLVSSVSGNVMSVSLHSNLDPGLYNVPLTLILSSMPVSVSQGGSALQVESDGSRFFVDVQPSSQPILITF